MKQQRPYLFDAIYRWIIDNGWTPHLLVNTKIQGVEVPTHLIQNDQIVLNIIPSAIANFFAEDFGLSFSARFAGKSQQIIVPYSAMLALFAREGGQGMVFPPEDFEVHQSILMKDTQAAKSTQPKDKEKKPKDGEDGKRKKPSLKLIK